MKTTLIFCFLCLPIFVTAQTTYWVESIQLDSLVLTIKNSVGQLQSQASIKSTRTDNTQFFFEVEKSAISSLQLYCNDCEQAIEFTLLNFDNNTHTKVLKTQSGVNVSVIDCFDQYKAPSGLWRFLSDPLGYIKQFIGYNQKHLTSRRRTQILRGGNTKSNTQDPKMYYEHADYSYYSNLLDLRIPFKVYENHPIKSIYILSHEGDLLFAAGSMELLADIFEINNQPISAPETILNEISSENSKKGYVLDYQRFKPHLKQSITSGKCYQIGIQLANDVSSFNPYLYNFQLVDANEINKLTSIIKQSRK